MAFSFCLKDVDISYKHLCECSRSTDFMVLLIRIPGSISNIVYAKDTQIYHCCQCTEYTGRFYCESFSYAEGNVWYRGISVRVKLVWL